MYYKSLGGLQNRQQNHYEIIINLGYFFSYSNSPFYWDKNHGKYGQQVFGNSNPDEPLPTIKKEKGTKKPLYWKETRKEKGEWRRGA